MSDQPQFLPAEPASAPAEDAAPAPRPPAPPLPSSPLERAQLESEGKLPTQTAEDDRTTMVAFGLLFVVPLLIIILSLVFLLPFINAQINRDQNPGGAVTQSAPNGQTPTR